MRTRALLRNSFQGIRCISGPYRPYQRLRIEKSSAWLGAHAQRDPADEVNSGPTMDNGAVDKNALVERLHSTPTKLVVFVSGGGSQVRDPLLVQHTLLCLPFKQPPEPSWVRIDRALTLHSTGLLNQTILMISHQSQPLLCRQSVTCLWFQEHLRQSLRHAYHMQWMPHRSY